MVGSRNTFTESMHSRGELDAIMLAESQEAEELQMRVDQNGGICQDEVEKAIGDFHRVFIGTYMGETVIADSVYRQL